MTDKTTSDKPGDSPSFHVFRIIEERLEDLLKREEDVDFRGVRDSQRTNLIGRISIVLVMILTPPVFYLIWTLVGDMGIITERMDYMKVQVADMRTDFDEVAMRMTEIDTSVSNMSNNIAVIPPMELRLHGMRGDVDTIAAAMGGIAPNVTTIDHTLGIMDQDMAQMSYVFGFLNRDVFSMTRHVNQMSSPMRMIPFFGR